MRPFVQLSQFGMRHWLCAILAGGALALTPVTLTSAPPPAAEQRPILSEPPPHPAEVALLDELSAWAQKDEAHSLEIDWLRHDQDRARARVVGLPFGQQIHSAALRAEVDPLLLAAVVEAESRFDPNAVSPQGALGLLQVMPATAQNLGSHDAAEPTSNLDAGARYLGEMLKRFDGNLPLALAAYNAGPGAVARFGGVPPFTQTRRYIERVMRFYLGHLRAVAELDALAAERG